MPIISQAKIDTLVETAVKVAKDEAAKATKILNESHSKEILEIKNKTVQEISELTSQKDTVEFSAKQATAKITLLEQAKTKGEELLGLVQEKLKYARKPKVVEQTLPTGNKLIRKVNKNGAKMTHEVTTEGKNVSYTVETLDGMVRKTTYDPTTGKPITSFSTSSGKPLQQKYKNGRMVEEKEINVKKPKTDKPYALNDAKKVERDGNWLKTTIPYSDGTKVVREASSTTGELFEETFFNTKGECSKHINHKDDYVETIVARDGFKPCDIYVKYNNGTTIAGLNKTNDLGIEQKIQTTKYSKAENTEIKSKKEIFNTDKGNQQLLSTEERTLKNGDLVTIKFNPRKQKNQGNAAMVYDFKVDSIEISPKKGEKILLSREDALKYLKENEPPHIPINGCNDKTLKHAYV